MGHECVSLALAHRLARQDTGPGVSSGLVRSVTHLAELPASGEPSLFLAAVADARIDVDLPSVLVGRDQVVLEEARNFVLIHYGKR